jgi:S1-C subfamily serine protease
MPSFEPQDTFNPNEPPPRPTTPPVRRGFLIVLAILFVIAALVYGSIYAAGHAGYAWEAGRARAAAEALAKIDTKGVINPSSLYRLAVVAVSPAVVHIEAGRTGGPGAAEGPPGGDAAQIKPQIVGTTEGSGFVIDKARGYIVTNSHVVHGADFIRIRLVHGIQLSAQLVGEDRANDLAVLQIPAALETEIQWGDSDKLAAGDAVLAIGSPFMLDHSVTAGIISATSRRTLIEERATSFLQTDAKINPGNSGGPLVDLTGKVIGITTAIFAAEHSDSDGIGLAIPSNAARVIADTIIKTGTVRLRYLGVMSEAIKPEEAARLKLAKPRGVVIRGVRDDSPAERAGLARDDVIVNVGGVDVDDPLQLRAQVQRVEVGKPVSIAFYRAGELKTVQATIDEPAAIDPLGLQFVQLPPGRAGNPIGALIINAVTQGSPAARAGLVPGMKVIGIGKSRVHTRQEYAAALAKLDRTEKIPFEVQLLNGEIKFFSVDVGSQDGAR